MAGERLLQLGLPKKATGAKCTMTTVHFRLTSYLLACVLAFLNYRAAAREFGDRARFQKSKHFSESFR